MNNKNENNFNNRKYNTFIDISTNLSNNIDIFNIFINIDSISCNILYNQFLSSINDFNKYFINHINKENISRLNETFPGTFKKLSSIDENIIKKNINIGFLLLYISDYDLLYSISLPNIPERTTSESILDPINIFGARDGLVENLEKNIAMIQRRLRNNNLEIETKVMGKRTATDVNIIYIKDIADNNNINLLKNELSKINTDSILSIDDITSVFNKNSIFPLTGESSSPDVICSSLLKGRIIIIIDQIPVAIILPVTILFFSTLKEETSSPFYYTLYLKIVTILMLFFSVFFLGLYIGVVNYHASNLSLTIISEVKVTARGTTIPMFLEMLIILMVFEFLKLASTKTPSNHIQNVIVIVGGFLIGQSTINSGFIGAFNLVVSGICFLSAYGVTNNQKLIVSLSILRILLMVSSILMGIYGFIITSIIVIIYLYNLKSLNCYYLAPIAPLFRKEIFYNILSKTRRKNQERPKSLSPIDGNAGGMKK